MKIIQVHNYYQQAGGEDAVVAAERAMLEGKGNMVVPYYRTNDQIGASDNTLIAIGSMLKASVQTLWNWETFREFRKLLRKEAPDVVHCHNFFPLISPSIYWACWKEKVPVVQTLHNYRLLCLNAFLFRQTKAVSRQPLAISSASEVTDNYHGKIGTERNESQKETDQQRIEAQSCKLNAEGSICEECIKKKFKYPGVKYGCYHDSKAGSLVVALMILFHKMIGTWSKKVTAYIALTDFQKAKMVEGGLPEDKIFVKPNFIATGDSFRKLDSSVKPENLKPNPRTPNTGTQSAPCALFVGRLSPEKGCEVLIRAWSEFWKQRTANSRELVAGRMSPQLLIVGDGSERNALEKLSTDLCPPSSVHFLGLRPKNEVLTFMRSAQFLVLPSVWYEGFPMTIVESFSCGTPVVASNDGGMGDIIEEKQNGLKFLLGAQDALANKMAWAFDHPNEMKTMGVAAHRDFVEKYSAEVNYAQLVDIYRVVMQRTVV